MYFIDWLYKDTFKIFFLILIQERLSYSSESLHAFLSRRER